MATASTSINARIKIHQNGSESFYLMIILWPNVKKHEAYKIGQASTDVEEKNQKDFKIKLTSFSMLSHVSFNASNFIHYEELFQHWNSNHKANDEGKNRKFNWNHGQTHTLFSEWQTRNISIGTKMD